MKVSISVTPIIVMGGKRIGSSMQVSNSDGGQFIIQHYIAPRDYWIGCHADSTPLESAACAALASSILSPIGG